MQVSKLKKVILGLALIQGAMVYAAEPFNVRFSWKLKGEYAPLYVAQDQGYFTQHGLDVKLGEGAGSQAALGALLQGQADAVVLPASFALTAITRGMPIKLVALYHPAAPIGVMSRAEKPINVPKDLEGKKIAISVGDTVAAYIGVVCQTQKIDCNKIERVIMDPNVRSSQMVAGRIDGVTTYTNIEPMVLEAAGTKITVLDFSKYGMTLPGLSVVVREDQITKKSKELAGFLAAVDQGIAESRKDTLAAADILIKSWTAAPPRDVVKKQIDMSLAAIPVYPGKPSGWIEESDLKKGLETLVTAGEISSVKPLTNYYSGDLF